jgi:hypothetical protein
MSTASACPRSQSTGVLLEIHFALARLGLTKRVPPMPSIRSLALAATLALAASVVLTGAAGAQTQKGKVKPQPAPRAVPVQEDQSFLYLAPSGRGSGPANYVNASNSPAATVINPLMFGQGATDWLQQR